ncbi:repeat protein [Moumouvirus goulette]|uniref:Repeat protein n=1 Tax=Moumouvirus goulette TaxID=1247379 RepID=M1PY39_9VIRU|nr:repeat protein [Moumouvirus goulette]AGF85697.1 repeat protein [Moumouvirus goulette]
MNKYEKLFEKYLSTIGNDINSIDKISGHTILTLLCDYYLICFPQPPITTKNYYNNYNKKIIYDIIKSFIKKGTDVNQYNANNLTPLLIIAKRRSNPIYLRVIKLLLKNGANINAVDEYGNSALILACYQNDIELAELLINSGINVNIASFCGTTALIIATYKSGHDNNFNLIKLLLERGANINAINIYGRSALISACIYSNKCDNLKTIKLLLEYWPDINLTNNNSQNALMICSQYVTSLETIKLLVEHWSNICSHDINICKGQCNNSAINIAKSEGNYDIVEFLEKI